ncbi:MAG: peptidoglycan DD-metalloendopeptidase family protein [Propionibacteriaceae bacterium]|nr:peptidoglycan DD-metalloendopeptidase family protein [Propionibacteriaceae bacterium]
MNRDFPPAIGGPRNAMTGLRRLGIAAVCAVLSLTAAPLAFADDLTDQRSRLKEQMAQTRSQIDEFSGKVAAAVEKYNASKAQLAEAEAKLAAAESATSSAKREDDLRAAELAAAEAALEAAKAEVIRAKAAVEEERGRMGEVVRENMVAATPLVNFAMFVEDLKTSDIGSRLQYSAAVFSARSANMDRLTEAQFRLEAAEQRAAEAEQQAEQAKQRAAEQLAETQRIEAEAAELRGRVASLVESNAKLKGEAESELAKAESDYKQMESESAELDRRIAARIEAQRREEAARASRSSSSRGSSGGGGGSYSSNSSLFWPAQGRPGSPFGMRLHPILGYYRMHWGTDIGAGCNTPLYAAGDGVVTEKFYNSGYGNRLVIDVGRINGSYISVGYAHATRYIVGKGERVSRGQIVGYVGTTGLSTGCHLHLEVWQNGTKVNPMKWF